MKNILLIAASIIALNVYAGNGHSTKEHPNNYCAKMKNGKLVIMHENAEMNSDVTLSNGTVIKTDGTIMKKDGTKTMLKDGECVDKDGMVMEEKKK